MESSILCFLCLAFPPEGPPSPAVYPRLWQCPNRDSSPIAPLDKEGTQTRGPHWLPAVKLGLQNAGLRFQTPSNLSWAWPPTVGERAWLPPPLGASVQPQAVPWVVPHCGSPEVKPPLRCPISFSQPFPGMAPTSTLQLHAGACAWPCGTVAAVCWEAGE